MARFILAPAIEAQSEPLAQLGLCEARLMRDGRWPWIVLVPRVGAAREIEDLSAAQRALLIEEMTAAGSAVRAAGAALGLIVHKLNLGALGNVTPQLHVHVVGRRTDDPCWPDPVWGRGAPTAPDPQALDAALAAARKAFEAALAEGGGT